METIGMYFLKMTCWLMVFWLVYYFFLKKESSYQFNRWFLVSGMISSIFMPLYTLRYTVIEVIAAVPPPPPPPATMNMVVDNAPAHTINWWAIVYLVGISSFLIITAFRLIRIHKLEMNGERTQHGNTNVIVINHDLAPFSFFNKIFVSHSLQGKTEIDSVIAHEKVHIEEKHWIDLFLLGIIRVMQWFNPLINLYRKAVMQNHEYLADSGAMQKGINPFAYKALLANQMLGYQVVGAVSSFGSINPSKRIEMMNKNKFKRKKQWLSLTVLPLIALVLFAFAEPEYEFVTHDSNELNLGVSTISVQGIVLNEEGAPIPFTKLKLETSNKEINANMHGEFSIDKITKHSDITFSAPGFNDITSSTTEKMKIIMESNGGIRNYIPEPPTYTEETIYKTTLGKITNLEGDYLSGVAVSISGTQVGTISGLKGNFQLEYTTPEAILDFAFPGYEKLSIAAEPNMKIILKAEKNSISSTKQTETSGIVTDKDGKALFGVAVLVEGTKVGTITDMEGKFLLKEIDKKATLSFMFPGFEQASLKAKKNMKVMLKKSTESDEILIIDDEKNTPPPPPPGIKVSGKVTDENGDAIPGTSVIIKGSTRGTVSDMQGNFELIGVAKDDEIVFSFVGMQTIKLKAKSKLNPVLTAKTHMIYVGDTPPPPPPPKAAKNVKQQEIAPPPPPPAPKEGDKIYKSTGENEVFIIVEDMPKVEGGSAALKKLSEKVFGKDFFKEGESIEFTVMPDGSLKNLAFNFTNRKDPEISIDKKRIFTRKMPEWTPGKQRGKAVAVRMSILF